MALKLHATYPGRFDSPSENYPQGKWRNRSNPTAHDGGYLEEKHMNDVYGFFGALLHNAEMTPNGEVDTAKKSQFYEALVRVAKSVIGEEGYRKLDDNVFNGLMTIKSDNDEQETGVFLQDTDGTVRGQVVATDQGLQLAQYPKDGGLQTFTFPRYGDGGECIVDKNLAQELGDSEVLAVSQKAVKDSLQAHGLGYEQSWVDVMSQRELGANYVNNTPKPIYCIVGISHQSNIAGASASVDGVTVQESATFKLGADAAVRLSLTFIVPPLSSYKVKGNGGFTLQNWTELR